jgi:hypothetical protein
VTDDAHAAANHVRGELTTVMDTIRARLEDVDLPVEVALLAVQVVVDGLGPMVVALTHPENGSERVVEIAREVGRIYADAVPPLLKVVFNELRARGWEMRGDGTYVDPEGNAWRTLEDAISAQSFREIAALGDQSPPSQV